MGFYPVGLYRLASKDRLKGWGMDVDAICVLCNQIGESHEHLFFECADSKIVWNRWLGKNHIRLPGKWSYEIDWAIKNCGRSQYHTKTTSQKRCSWDIVLWKTLICVFVFCMALFYFCLFFYLRSGHCRCCFLTL